MSTFSTNEPGASRPPETPQSQQPQHQLHPQLQLDHNGLSTADAQAIAAAAATAVSHHGLQALQAAVAPTPTPAPAIHSPVTPQYASPIDNAYLSAQVPAPGSVPVGAPGSTPASQKVTRLRRACDMCSQRKVKVRNRSPDNREARKCVHCC